MADEESAELLLRGERRRGSRLSRVVAAGAALALLALAAALLAPARPRSLGGSAALARLADDATATCEEDDGCADGYRRHGR